MKIGLDDTLLCRMVGPMMNSVRAHVPEFAGMQPGDRVLDICCGTGSQTLEYARRGIIAGGIDLDPGMIETADRRRRASQIRNAYFHTADAMDLPFEDDSYDYISITLALHQRTENERDAVISEMKRVVKSDGSLVIIDYTAPLPRVASAYFSQALESVTGGKHRTCFKWYVAQGGLETIIEHCGLRVDKQDEMGPLTFIKSLIGRQDK